MKNAKDLIKYLELKQYKLSHLQKATTQLKDSLSLDKVLYFYELVKHESFEYFTKHIEQKLKDKGINIEEEIVNEIEQCFNENKIIKINIIIFAMKKYIFRTIKDKDKDNYLFNLNELKDKDLWDMTIYGTNEFNEEFNKLVFLDKNEKDAKNVVKYLYSKIYNIEIEEYDEYDEI